MAESKYDLSKFVITYEDFADGGTENHHHDGH